MSNIVTRIEDLAFEEILRSVYETLRVECTGSLFGYKWETKTSVEYIVQSAHAVQLAERYPSKVKPINGSSRANYCILDSHMGDFHSHLETVVQEKGVKRVDKGKLSLSKSDKRKLKEDKGKIEIITALNRVKGKVELTSPNPFVVSGYIEDDGKTTNLIWVVISIMEE